MKLLVFIITLIVFEVSSVARTNVAFIGLSGENAPSLEKGYEKLLREKLAMNPDFYTADYLECQRYRRLMKFDDYQIASRKSAETLINFANDSTLLLWGAVKSYRLYSERKKFIFTSIKGELLIGLHLFSLAEKDFLFIGDVKAIVSKNKGLAFFHPSMPVSATEGAKLIEMLQTEAANNSSRIISALIRSKMEGDIDLGVSNEKQNREPSISDVFSIPSTEPAQITPVVSPDTANKTMSDKKK